MNDALTIPVKPSLVALTPAELPVVQAQLADWCRSKCVALGRELQEQRQNLRIAKASKWNTKGWSVQVSRTKGQMVYYSKIRMAVEAGFLIVPNFDVEIMAVRTTRVTPKWAEHNYANQDVDDAGQRTPPLLPGAGDYVGHTIAVRNVSEDQPDPSNPGKRRIVKKYQAEEYTEPHFPVQVVRPIVLEATQRAMALKLFDRIGVVKGHTDPIVVGQLLAPRVGYSQKHVSFFIAWWLDVSTL